MVGVPAEANITDEKTDVVLPCDRTELLTARVVFFGH
jgi:hypothetical protein